MLWEAKSYILRSRVAIFEDFVAKKKFSKKRISLQNLISQRVLYFESPRVILKFYFSFRLYLSTSFVYFLSREITIKRRRYNAIIYYINFDN